MAVLWFIFMLSIASSKAKEVKTTPRRIPRVTPCGCRYKDKLYDLSKLAESNGSARFTIASGVKDNFYSYNPCIPFTITTNISIEYHCDNVAICYWSKDGQRRDPLGYQHPGQIHCELSTDRIRGNRVISLVYLQGGQGRKTNYTATIEMVCDRTKIYPEDATMKIKPGHSNSSLPVFQVFHKCCCPEGCTTCPEKPSGLSIYYEIGTAVGGVVFTFVAGFIGFTIAKKKYHRDGPDDDDRLLPRPRNIGYGAANQQERPDGQGAGGYVNDDRDRGGGGGGDGGGGGGGGGSAGGAGAGAINVVGVADRGGQGIHQDQPYDSLTDSDGNASDLDISDGDFPHGSPVSGDDQSRSTRSGIPSEHDDASARSY